MIRFGTLVAWIKASPPKYAEDYTGEMQKITEELELRVMHKLQNVSGANAITADAVPGISGGTVALVIGIYRQLIGSIAAVLEFPLQRDSAALRTPLGFLLPLGLGIVAAYWLVSRLLIGPAESPGILLQPGRAVLCYGLFTGLVAASLREPWRRIPVPGQEHLLLAGQRLQGFRC